jgi:hypothetical protein
MSHAVDNSRAGSLFQGSRRKIDSMKEIRSPPLALQWMPKRFAIGATVCTAGARVRRARMGGIVGRAGMRVLTSPIVPVHICHEQVETRMTTAWVFPSALGVRRSGTRLVKFSSRHATRWVSIFFVYSIYMLYSTRPISIRLCRMICILVRMPRVQISNLRTGALPDTGRRVYVRRSLQAADNVSPIWRVRQDGQS